MNKELKDRLHFWKEKANQITHDHWVRFIIYWMIFDAYITEESGRDNDQGKLNWFNENDNELKNVFRECWSEPEYIENLKKLKELSPINDMRPSKRGIKNASLNDISNEREVFNFIYQIRCNTFHGAKDLWNPKDHQLVRISQKLLKKPLDLLLK